MCNKCYKRHLWKNSHNEVYEESFVVMVVLSELGWCWRRRRVDCFHVVKSKTREIATFWMLALLCCRGCRCCCILARWRGSYTSLSAKRGLLALLKFEDLDLENPDSFVEQKIGAWRMATSTTHGVKVGL